MIEIREALVALTREVATRNPSTKNRKRYIESFYLSSDGRAT